MRYYSTYNLLCPSWKINREDDQAYREQREKAMLKKVFTIPEEQLINVN
jgi:hypothetical protein